MAQDGLQQFADMHITLREVHLPQTLQLAAPYQPSACDAAHLWLAAEIKALLVTFDDKLATAARAHLAALD